MKNLKKKGFTIVELVIVIAVIAILSAVLIPTFSSLIRKANIANDKAVAKELNTALAIVDAEKGIDDFYDVIDALSEYGFIITNLNAKSEGCFFVWEKETNQIVLVDSNDGYNVIYALKENYGQIDDSWFFAINDATLATKVQGDYANANVFTSFETPSTNEISVPLTELGSMYNKVSEDANAEEDLYIAIPTNGAIINEIKIGNNVYTSEDTFKLSIGSNKFITFNYIKEDDQGNVMLAAPVVAFDSEARYGVLGDTLVMTTNMNEDNTISELSAYLRSTSGSKKIEKNSNGQYVIELKAGEKNNMFLVQLPEVSSNDVIIRRNGFNTGGFGYTACEKLSTYGGEGYGYGTYISYGTEYTSSLNGTYTFELYVIGKGYISFDLVVVVK